MVYNNDYKMCIVHAHYLHAIRRWKRALVFKQENGFWVGLYILVCVEQQFNVQ